MTTNLDLLTSLTAMGETELAAGLLRQPSSPVQSADPPGLVTPGAAGGEAS